MGISHIQPRALSPPARMPTADGISGARACDKDQSEKNKCHHQDISISSTASRIVNVLCRRHEAGYVSVEQIEPLVGTT